MPANPDRRSATGERQRHDGANSPSAGLAGLGLIDARPVRALAVPRTASPRTTRGSGDRESAAAPNRRIRSMVETLTRQLFHGHPAAKEHQPRSLIGDASSRAAGHVDLGLANASIHDAEVAEEDPHLVMAGSHRDHRRLAPVAAHCPTIDDESGGKQEQEKGEREERRGYLYATRCLGRRSNWFGSLYTSSTDVISPDVAVPVSLVSLTRRVRVPTGWMALSHR